MTLYLRSDMCSLPVHAKLYSQIILCIIETAKLQITFNLGLNAAKNMHYFKKSLSC